MKRKKKELDQTLLDTELYNDKERHIIINKQHKSVSAELNDLYKKWEVLHTELEAVDAGIAV